MKSLLALLLLPGLLLRAGAQERAREDGDERLEPLVIDADDDKNRIIPAHVAGNATVIDAETIASSGARSVAELLASRGGIRLTSSTGNPADASVHLRGFGENSASRALILIDGRPVNRADMASVSWLEVPLARLDRVEILRGSHSARFGDNAVGGVINLVTRGGNTTSTVVEAAAGSDASFIARASHHQAVAGNRLGFDFESNLTDGWRDNAFSELQSGSIRWDRDIHRTLQADLSLSWADQSGGFPGPLTLGRYLADPRQSIYALFGQADQYFSEQTRWLAEGGITWGNRSDLFLEFPLSFLRRDLEWNFGPGFHSDNLLDTLTLQPTLGIRRDTWSADVGIHFRRDRLDLQQYAEIQRLNRTSAAALDRQILGIHAGAEWELLENWHFSVAARWEQSDLDASSQSDLFPADPTLNFARGTEESHRAFQAGLRWEPQPDLALWFRYDRLYRLPSTDEIASYQGFPLTVPFNDQLRAETGHNLELGGEWTLGNWTLGLNGFAQWMEGEIIYDYLANLNVNLADTKRMGLETTLGYDAGNWNIDLRHTALQARFDSGPYQGKEVFLVPNHEVTATLGWRPTEKLSLQAEYQWIASSYEGNDFLNVRPKLPAYDVVNLLVRYEPQPGLSVYARVNNLLDETYATLKYNGLWYPAAGRQFLVGLRQEF
ncbi:MAG: TonB-dependent receptor [Akkermansiaceae bacterium]|nr:TonB-dependent receptor [Akkermansiaceae bacterium]